jgi:GNAT superfamily N-acetyltransferase
MLGPEQLRPVPLPEGIRIEQASPCPADLYRRLYREVGERYHWIDRRDWTDHQILTHLGDGSVSIWLLREAGQLAGYFELVRHQDGSIEIAYFGLLNEHLGRGLGKMMLTGAVQTAWSMGATRVWLHTCTLDHPAALPNYLARGFTVFKRETYFVQP